MFTINMRQCNEITQIYERQAEECVRAVSRFYDDITDLARRTTYAPMVHFGNEIYRFYTGELREHLIRQFQIWYDGNYSFHALMQKINAGEAAVQEGRAKMNQMEEYLQSLFRLSASEISLDTSAPDIENKDFEDYRQALSTCIRSFESAVEEANAAIGRMGSDNDVVLLIGDMVKTTGVSLYESFQEMVNQVTSGEEFTSGGRDFTIGEITGRGVTVESKSIQWGKSVAFY